MREGASLQPETLESSDFVNEVALQGNRPFTLYSPKPEP